MLQISKPLVSFQSNIPYHEMLFFDDEYRNVADLKTFGKLSGLEISSRKQLVHRITKAKVNLIPLFYIPLQTVFVGSILFSPCLAVHLSATFWFFLNILNRQ